jgi:hypothetical protein
MSYSQIKYFFGSDALQFDADCVAIQYCPLVWKRRRNKEARAALLPNDSGDTVSLGCKRVMPISPFFKLRDVINIKSVRGPRHLLKDDYCIASNGRSS